MKQKQTKQFYSVYYNKDSKTVEIDIYGQIINGGKESKWDETDFTLSDLKEKLEEADDFDTIVLNVSSPGGSVFVASAMMSILQKHKNRGVKVKAYVIGVAASAASYFIMVADEIYMGESAMLMIHKPLISSLFFIANATKLRKLADDLDDMEDGVLINAYMKKATDKLTKEKLKIMLEEETWLSSGECREYFNIELIEEESDMVALMDEDYIDVLSKYQNLPNQYKNLINNKNTQSSSQSNDLQKQKLKLQLELI